MLRCESENIEQMYFLRSVTGPSSGKFTTGTEIREAVEARELSVGTEDFRDRYDVVEGRADRVDTRPGIVMTGSDQLFSKVNRRSHSER